MLGQSLYASRIARHCSLSIAVSYTLLRSTEACIVPPTPDKYAIMLALPPAWLFPSLNPTESLGGNHGIQWLTFTYSWWLQSLYKAVRIILSHFRSRSTNPDVRARALILPTALGGGILAHKWIGLASQKLPSIPCADYIVGLGAFFPLSQVLICSAWILGASSAISSFKPFTTPSISGSTEFESCIVKGFTLLGVTPL